MTLGFVVACMSVEPLFGIIDGLASADPERALNALAPNRLRAALVGLPYVLMICLPGFLVLRFGLFLLRLRSALAFALAGAVNAVISLQVLTYGDPVWPVLTGLNVLLPAGLVAGAIHWAVERAVLGPDGVLARRAAAA